MPEVPAVLIHLGVAWRYHGLPLWAGEHVHWCPVSYVPCEMTCSIEPDLTRRDGTLCGGMAKCDDCVRSLSTPLS